MADYIDQVYAAKRNAANNSLKQRRDEQLAQYDTQGAQDTQAYNQGLPQYQDQRNQADVGAFQDTQKLAERAAQSGSYNGGQTDSNLARIMQTASNNKAGFTNQENQFKQNYANNQNTLAGSRARANNAYSGDITSSNMGIDAEIAQAREQQRQHAAQVAAKQAAQRVAASRATASRSASAKAPTAAQLKASTFGDVDNAYTQGTSLTTIEANVRNNAASYAAAGIDYNSVLKYAQDKYAAAGNAYVAAGPTAAQQDANNITNSAFSNRGPYAGNSSSIGGFFNNH